MSDQQHADDDDVWASDGADGDYDRHIAGRDEARLREQYATAGFREGVNEGKRDYVQPGFDHGFEEGIRTGKAIGRIRGAIVTLRALGRLDQLQEPLKEQVLALELAIKQYDDADKIFSTEHLCDVSSSKDNPSNVASIISNGNELLRSILTPIPTTER